MKVFLATIQPEPIKHPESKANWLMSYWYVKNRHQLMHDCLDVVKANQKMFLVDSGVYTARKKGVDIPLGEYLEFCRQFKDKATYFFNLDLGSYETQLHNYKTLVAEGIPTVAIISEAMSDDQVQRMIDAAGKYAYLGISYTATGTDKASGAQGYRRYLDRLYAYLFRTNQTFVKTHALGLTKLDMMLNYPFYSCDSSTWCNTERFGASYVFKDGGLYTIPRKAAITGIKKFGILSEKQRPSMNEDRTERYVASVKEFVKMEEYVTNIWTQRGITYED